MYRVRSDEYIYMYAKHCKPNRRCDRSGPAEHTYMWHSNELTMQGKYGQRHLLDVNANKELFFFPDRGSIYNIHLTS